MLRSLLIGVLSVTALAACKGKEGGPAVQAGVAAGKVVELSGTVTAKRGTESRPLASGTEVSGDDVIETGADSSVSIVLAHNNATWSLGPNKREKVADSLAWSLAKVDQPAGGSVESTSAAGRHAEKAGANSTATAAADEVRLQREEPAAAEPPPPPPPPAPGTAPVVAPPSRGAAASQPDNAAPPPAQSPAAAPRPAAPAEPAPKAAVSSSPQGGARKLESGTPPQPAMLTNKKNASELQRLALAESKQLRACLHAPIESVAVVIVVRNGNVSVEIPARTPSEVKACIEGVVAKLKPSAGLTDKLTLTITRI